MKSFICPFLLKHGDCHVKLCVLFFSDFCFVHVQGSMNSCMCYNKVWTCFVLSSILTSTSIAKETTVVYTTAVEPNVPKVGTSKPKINQKVLYCLLNSRLFWLRHGRNGCFTPTLEASWLDAWNSVCQSRLSWRLLGVPQIQRVYIPEV